ncbi:hypothetical protein Tco_0588251 [Tanacetum coccineum]
MDDPSITMEEYIQLMADKDRGHGQTFNWETATYDDEYYDDLDSFTDFETYFPAIDYNDASTSNQNVSSEPTVSIFNAIKYDIDFHISFSDSEDKDYTFIYNKDSSSYKLIPSNDLKSEPVNDYVDINIESCSENINDKPMDSVICISNDTTPIEFNENIETSHDTSGINTAYPGDLVVNEIDSKEMDDPNITMEEYIQLMADKARGHDFETYFPAIVYNDAPTSNQNVSSEPTVSIFNAIKSDIDFHISFSDSEDEDYTFIYNKDSSSYKLIPSNDLKSEPVNDYVDINIESCSENINDKPMDSVSCISNDTTPIEFDENIETNHDTSDINTAYPGDLAVNEIDSKVLSENTSC